MTIKEIRSHIRAHLVRLHNSNQEMLDGSLWTDGEINKYINEAYRDFLSVTKMLKETSTVTFTDGIGSMPDGVINIDRIEISDVPIGRLQRKSYEGALPV